MGTGPLRLWFLDWELDDREPADWDDAARPYLQNFLTLHTPPQGKPKITKKDFKQLLHTLGCAGYGRKGLKGNSKKWPTTGPARRRCRETRAGVELE